MNHKLSYACTSLALVVERTTTLGACVPPHAYDDDYYYYSLLEQTQAGGGPEGSGYKHAYVVESTCRLDVLSST